MANFNHDLCQFIGRKTYSRILYNKKYEVKVIIDSVVYNKEMRGQMPGFYYLVL